MASVAVVTSGVLGGVTAGAAGGAVPGVTSAAAATSSVSAWVPDGSSPGRAAASCWEVKQRVPAAVDGVYWLQTPTLVTPERFSCDMTTDGGGWVLVGRGRDGWVSGGDGQGSVAQVRDHVWDQSGFKPRQLSDAVIDGLLDGRAPSSLPDGVRVVRAADSAGVTTTDVRFRLTRMPRWSWAFSAGQPATATLYDASSNRNTARRTATVRTGATTRDVDGGGYTRGGGLSRLWTYLDAVNGWVSGFNYGQSVTGSSAAATFLYAARGSYPTPMTQVWLRPTLTTDQVSYPKVPDAGAPEQVQPPLAESGALPGTWGVVGQANGRYDELDTEAHAFAQIGDVMYVGGNFARVEEHPDRTPGGVATQSVPQRYLAAFDVRTGAWIPGFRPTFDNQVNSLAALPDGRLAVGGEFGTVNGAPHPGLVALDPATGATVTGWRIMVEDRIRGERVNVQTMDLQDGWLYLGGNFTHLTGGPASRVVYARKAARVAVGDATPDAAWNPAFDGKVQAIDASSDGRRVYAAGYFTKAGTTAARNAAVVSTEPGAALLRFTPLISDSTGKYQQAVHEAGSTFWLGGSQHSMFGYDSTTLAPTSLNIMREGGDVQSITVNDRVVYGGCHCGDWAFSGQQAFSFTVGTSNPTWKQADAIEYVGAWDAVTGSYLPAFKPSAKVRGGYGAWGLQVASDGTLWAGGSYTSVVARDGRNQWAGGFVRFAARPHTAPPAPQGLTARLSGQVATLSWSSAAAAGTTYEVLRGGRVVATTAQTSIDIGDSSQQDRFFVRATDGQGNRSATTVVAVPEIEPTRVDLVGEGSTWRYAVGPAAAADGWATAAFDATSWRTGAAPLGWGSDSIATDLGTDAGQQRPITSYFRKTFDVTDPAQLADLTLTTRADDGVVVYLNGAEVARQNLPDGAVGPTTYATVATKTSAAVAAPLVVPLDPSSLVAGPNVVGVEVHANYRSTPNVSMELRLSARLR